MNSGSRCGFNNSARPLTAAFVAAAFLWTLFLAVSPQLHARIHTDAGRKDHACAVTFVASGSYDHAAQVPVLAALVAVRQFSAVPILTPQWVESPFLSARIFEHAPPA